MEEEPYDDWTTNDTYPLYINETTEDELHMYDGDGSRLALCESGRKIVPTFVEFINASLLSFPQEWKATNYAATIRLSVFVTIIVVGIIGNIGVILTIALNRSMKTTVNVYIANLASADVMTCIFAGAVFYDVLGNDYFFGRIPCKFFGFALYTCLECSILTRSAIAFDRFMAIVYPLHVRVTKQRKSLVLTIIWIVSMLVATPHLIINKLQTIQFKDVLDRKCAADWSNQRYHHQKYGYCNVKSAFYLFHSILQTVFLYFLPVLIIMTAYSFILWRLWRTKLLGEQIAANDNLHSKAIRRVHKMIFVMLIVFFICWTPYQIAVLYETSTLFDHEYPEWWPTFRWAAWFFYLGNSCMNPIIYALFEKDFRQGICTVLRCGKPVIKPKPLLNKPNALEGVSNSVMNLEMETSYNAVKGQTSPESKETSVTTQDDRKTVGSS